MRVIENVARAVVTLAVVSLVVACERPPEPTPAPAPPPQPTARDQMLDAQARAMEAQVEIVPADKAE